IRWQYMHACIHTITHIGRNLLLLIARKHQPTHILPLNKTWLCCVFANMAYCGFV
ncbi:hypothetical protein S245_050478, partial [Arachis hypogaea]